MYTLNGDNITYTLDDITNKNIIRDTLTMNNSDTLPSLSELPQIVYGTVYNFSILNNSDTYTITMSPGLDTILNPGPNDKIYPKTWKRYSLTVIDDVTIVYTNLDYNGTPLTSSKIISSNIEPSELSSNITLGVSGSTNINLQGPLTVYGNIYKYSSISLLETDTDLTYSVGQLLGSFIKRNCNTSNKSDTLPDANDILLAIPNVDIGTSFTCIIQNCSTSNYILTLLPGSNMNISGISIIEPDKALTILFVVNTTTIVDIDTIAITAYVLNYTVSQSTNTPISTIKNINSISQLPYNITYNDSTINVDTATLLESSTLTLPKITRNKYLFITDSSGKAGTYNITVEPFSGDTIMGNSSLIINSDYTSISLYNNETNTWLLY